MNIPLQCPYANYPMGWFGGAGWAKGKVLQPELPTLPSLCLPVPWHSQAVAEILHEWVQAGEGEERQDSKRQLE